MGEGAPSRGCPGHAAGRKHVWEHITFGSPQKTTLLHKFSVRTAIGEKNFPSQLNRLDLMSSVNTLLDANPAATDFKITSQTMVSFYP
jgi:hypothetical protein